MQVPDPGLRGYTILGTTGWQNTLEKKSKSFLFEDTEDKQCQMHPYQTLDLDVTGY